MQFYDYSSVIIFCLFKKIFNCIEKREKYLSQFNIFDFYLSNKLAAADDDLSNRNAYCIKIKRFLEFFK